MIDNLECDEIEVIIDDTGKIWINLDGRCVVRIGKPKRIKVDLKRSAPNLVLHSVR